MKQPRIVLVGHVCIDHNVSEHSTYTGWGSGTLYMASYAEKLLDIQPIVLTSYGQDFMPYAHEFSLWPREPQASETLVYKNITRDGARTQSCHNIQHAVPPVISPDAQKILATADIVVLATLLPNYSTEYVQELLSYAPKDCLKVCCPQGYFRHVNLDDTISPREFAEAIELLPLFDLTFLSEEDYPHAADVVHDWQKTPGMSDVVMTQGADGATIMTRTSQKRIPTHVINEADIVDSVGCGDTFAMAVSYNYYQNRDLRAAVMAGHTAARQKLLTVPASLRAVADNLYA